LRAAGEGAHYSDVTTLRGNGWLAEAPHNLVPTEWLSIRSRSQLKRCLLLPAPRVPFAGPADTLRDVKPFGADVIASHHPIEQSDRESYREPRRPDPMRRARIFALPEDLLDPRAKKRVKAKHKMPHEESERSVRPSHHDDWLASPLVMGILLMCLPPIGLAAVWGSPRYDRDARWALTFTTTLFMILVMAGALTLAR
jgi:hypothetical protein